MRNIAVACLLMGLAPAAVAQDGSETSAARTPENAQRFLGVTAEQYPILVTPNQFGYPYAALLNFKLTGFTPTGPCSSRVEGVANQFSAKDSSGNSVAAYASQPGYAGQGDPVALLASRSDIVEQYKLALPPYDIDWARVTSLGNPTLSNGQSNYVPKSYVQVLHANGAVTFMAPSEEMAGRMLLAMETLKRACDKTEGLGF